MKQKLTAEQRDWLNERLKSCDSRFIAHGVGYGISHDEIRQVINECTEKEFPEMLMSRGVNEWSIAICEPTDQTINISLSDPRWVNTLVPLKLDEFKEFAEGVAKIKEWIENNEKD